MNSLFRCVIAMVALLTQFLLVFPAQAEEAELKITEMAVTTKIVKGNPIDSVSRISSASVPALYCFTRITASQEGERTITHVWYRNGEKVAEYKLPVKGVRWRTYSRKTVDRESAGEWRVDAVDSSGRVIKSVKFKMN